MSDLPSEMLWLTLSTALTSLLALPYVINIMVKQWPLKGMRLFANPPEPGEDRYAWSWGSRAFGAHMNAVENLVVFAALVMAIQVTGKQNEITALASAIYFWARLIHALFYILNIPYVRTASWTIGWIANLMLIYQLLTS